jgi:hypothetical protein
MDRHTAVESAAHDGKLQLLLGCNARMERDGYGMTPLLAASVTGHTSIVENLIQEQPGRPRVPGGCSPDGPYESCCPTSREAAACPARRCSVPSKPI